MLSLIWLIPLLPLVGVAVNGLAGKHLPRKAVGGIACAVVLASFALALGATLELAGLPEHERYAEVTLGSWMPLGGIETVAGDALVRHDLTIDWRFALDPLSALLILIVTGVGSLIHVYSVGYMSHEADHARFFVYLNLFMAMMGTLVLAGNLLVMFVGWEGVGLCSYLLIGFYWDRPFDARTGMTCADAGRRAFIVNRIGDLAFLIGMLWLLTELGTLGFREISEVLAQGQTPGWLLAMVGLLLFFGACGKSAQIPLYVWLPDAMAGPTPVSALIHAATMVTAGVYMVCRMSPLFSQAPEALMVVASVGTLTALVAATMGVTATDLKKVLAYSTVSQLGFMFAAAGVGAYTAAMFHLMTHAFFKALLFLGAGSVIHALHDQQDIRRMGGLKSKLPVTFWTFAVATLAIAGFPLTAGFFSKDEILWSAWSGGHLAIWVLLTLTAFLTAFYMGRLTYLVFLGRFRGSDEEWSAAHESPRSMTLPLVVLALLSAIGGFVGVPAVFGLPNVLHHWLSPAIVPLAAHGALGAHGSEIPHSASTEWLLMGVATLVGLGGLTLAWAIYRREGVSERWALRLRPIYVTLRNFYWVDELYESQLIRPFYAACRLFRGVDRWVVDGVVNAAGVTTELTGQVIKLFQTGLVRNYALTFLLGVVAVLYYFMTL